MSTATDFQQQFFARLGHGLHLSPLFDLLPEVYLYVKDRQSRFVKVNNALLGLRGFDFAPRIRRIRAPRNTPHVWRRRLAAAAMTTPYVSSDVGVLAVLVGTCAFFFFVWHTARP